MTTPLRVNRDTLLISPATYVVVYTSANPYFRNNGVGQYMFTIGPLDVDYNVFPTMEDAWAHLDPTGITNVAHAVNEALGEVLFTEGPIVEFDAMHVFDALGNKADRGDTYVADAPADAVTNYDTGTTLLGALTDAVNSANTKQNDIATKLNALIAALKVSGVLKTSP